ncbi:MAG: sulfite exporter TauE/SafE family protein [Gammaproteobacteria bacterium]|nr:sulfite exporter TauE/SafE family protein [Gammaproteobacteria bacterium]
MVNEISLIAAFMVGLLGSVHCVGMCGGIVGILGVNTRPQSNGKTRALLPYIAAYNSGRLLSYSLAGVIVGALGGQLQDLLLQRAQSVGQYLAAAFLVALGLYISGWWQGLIVVERAGALLWRHLEPLGRRFLPVTSVAQALGLGLVWGWLPCGLVYSVLIWSLTLGDPVRGGLLLLAFGLGTLPMLLLMGVTAQHLLAFSRHKIVRAALGSAIITLGLYTAFTDDPDVHHHRQAQIAFISN